MTNWNFPKIREECLKLMGWTPSSYVEGASTYTHWHADETVKLDREDSTQFPPDPTTSLDDALPLMERYRLILTRLDNGWFAESVVFAAFDDSAEAMSDTAPLAVCLCALRCDGRDLDEFKVKP